MLINIALCTIASIAAFRNIHKSHNDIKPSKLMLTTDTQRVILIDFGSAVDFGDEDTSRGSSTWGGDCPAGSYEYDMACLASILFYLQRGSTDKGWD